MAYYYGDTSSVSDSQHIRHPQENVLDDIANYSPQSDWNQRDFSSSDECESPSTSPIEQWALRQPRAAFLEDPNWLEPSEVSSKVDMETASTMERRATPEGSRDRQLEKRYKELELELDLAQLTLDRLELARDKNPQTWGRKALKKYKAAEDRKSQAESALNSLSQSRRRPRPYPAAQQHHSESAPPILQSQGDRRQPSQNSYHPSQLRTPRAHTPVRSQRRRQTDPYAVLRQHEVPYLEAYQRIDSSTIGSATGKYRHCDSSVNNVSAGGYPIPDIMQNWYNTARDPTSHTAQAFFDARAQRYTPVPPGTLPFNAVAAWHNGVRFFKTGDYEASLAEFRTITDRPQTSMTVPHARIFYNIGLLHSLQSNYGSALAAFEQSTHHEPGLIISHYCLGVCLYKLEDVVKAMRAFDNAVSRFEANYQTVDYTPMGLGLVLQKTVVNFARDLCVRAFGGYQDIPMFEMGVVFQPVREDDGADAVVGGSGGGGGGGGDGDEEDGKKGKKAKGSIWKRMMRRIIKREK